MNIGLSIFVVDEVAAVVVVFLFVVNGVLVAVLVMSEGQVHDIDSLDNNIDDGMENSNEVAIAIASAAVVIQRPHLPLEQGVETQAICETPWIECGRVRNKSPLSIGGLIDD